MSLWEADVVQRIGKPKKVANEIEARGPRSHPPVTLKAPLNVWEGPQQKKRAQANLELVNIEGPNQVYQRSANVYTGLSLKIHILFIQPRRS